MLQPRAVDLNAKDYIIQGAKHMWQHKTLCLTLLLLMILVIGVRPFFNPYVMKIYTMVVGLYFLFLIMEVTFASTQEKYNPQKFFTSMLVSGNLLIKFIKDQKLFLLVLITIDLIFVAFGSSSWAIYKDSWISMQSSEALKAFMVYLLIYATPDSLLTIVAVGFCMQQMASDKYVLARMSSNLDMGFKEANEAYRLNNRVLKQMIWIVIAFTLMPEFVLVLKPILFIILAAGMIFYSMDVFNIDSGKKKRQEQEELNKKEMDALTPMHS